MLEVFRETEESDMTDTKITSEPAAMLRLGCGDFGILRGDFEVGQSITCPEVGCGVATTITGVEPIGIVADLPTKEAQR
jgi:hypothetical protein